MTTVTYDPQDDKLRVYFALRQPDDVLEPLKAAGFRWAGAQGCWFAVWNPDREDAALALDGVEGIDDEPGTLESRAEDRAERFADYRGSAVAERDARHKFVRGMTEALNGQPVLIGHHSEKRHRKLLARMDDSIRAAWKANERANYWQSRAAGSVAYARRKERPDVRARRIKTLGADLRRMQRDEARYLLVLETFTHERPLADLLALANDGRSGLPYGTWSKLRGIYEMSGEDQGEALCQVVDETRANSSTWLANRRRWIEHLNGRITYERDQLGEQLGEDGAEAALAPRKPSRGKAAVPLLNLPGGHPMTKAEWAAVWKDYKGSRVIKKPDGSPWYRLRTAIAGERRGLVFVTITDAKMHEKPEELTDEDLAQAEDPRA